MMRHIALCCFLILLLSCGQKEKLDFESLELKSEQCRGCPEVKINLPKALGNTRLASAINTALREEVISILSFEDTMEVSDLEQAIASFKQGYERIQKIYPDETPGWKAEVFAVVTYEDKNWVSIALNAYTFTGGAHGYGSVRYLNFDKAKGKELEPWQLFQDRDGFLNLAELKFRQQENIPPDQPINSTGFMFEEDHFYLPENIGLTAEGVKLHYNQYEVASYADGPIELTLPFGEVGHFLNYPGKS